MSKSTSPHKLGLNSLRNEILFVLWPLQAPLTFQRARARAGQRQAASRASIGFRVRCVAGHTRLWILSQPSKLLHQKRLCKL